MMAPPSPSTQAGEVEVGYWSPASDLPWRQCRPEHRHRPGRGRGSRSSTTTTCGPPQARRQLAVATARDRDWAYAGYVDVDACLRARRGTAAGRPGRGHGPAPAPQLGARGSIERGGAVNGAGSRRRLRRRPGLHEDWDLWIRLARLGPPAYVAEPSSPCAGTTGTCRRSDGWTDASRPAAYRPTPRIRGRLPAPPALGRLDGPDGGIPPRCRPVVPLRRCARGSSLGGAGSLVAVRPTGCAATYDAGAASNGWAEAADDVAPGAAVKGDEVTGGLGRVRMRCPMRQEPVGALARGTRCIGRRPPEPGGRSACPCCRRCSPGRRLPQLPGATEIGVGGILRELVRPAGRHPAGSLPGDPADHRRVPAPAVRLRHRRVAWR